MATANHERRRKSDRHWWLLPMFYVVFQLAVIDFLIGYVKYDNAAEAGRVKASDDKIIASQILSCRRNKVLRIAVNDFHRATQKFVLKLKTSPRATPEVQQAYEEFLSDIRTVPVFNCVQEVLRSTDVFLGGD